MFRQITKIHFSRLISNDIPIRYCSLVAQGSVVQKPNNEGVTNYDIIIVGGGMVGTTLALTIAKNSCLREKSVLLLEGAPKFKGFGGGEFSNRVSTLNNGTINLMKEIGAWEHIEAARHKPVKEMQVWDASSKAYITFERNNQNIARVVENDLVLDSVNRVLQSEANVTVKYNSRIEKVSLPNSSSDNGSVFLNSGEGYSCKLLIGADGAKSSVREAMNVDVYAINYKQMGVVATLELDNVEGDNSIAWQRFLPNGPVAILPLNDSKSSLVWSTTPEHAKSLLQMESQEFIKALNSALSDKHEESNLVNSILQTVDTVLGAGVGKQKHPPTVRSVVDKSRAAFPLGFAHASSYIKQGVALIGDAAHRIHPLAGQGVNLGYGDVSVLVKHLADAVYNGSDVNNVDYLLKYERERLQQNVPIMLGVHGLQRLYNTDFAPIVLARSIGLKITHNVPFIKKLFVEKAMA